MSWKTLCRVSPAVSMFGLHLLCISEQGLELFLCPHPKESGLPRVLINKSLQCPSHMNVQSGIRTGKRDGMEKCHTRIILYQKSISSAICPQKFIWKKFFHLCLVSQQERNTVQKITKIETKHSTYHPFTTLLLHDILHFYHSMNKNKQKNLLLI